MWLSFLEERTHGTLQRTSLSRIAPHSQPHPKVCCGAVTERSIASRDTNLPGFLCEDSVQLRPSSSSSWVDKRNNGRLKWHEEDPIELMSPHVLFCRPRRSDVKHVGPSTVPRFSNSGCRIRNSKYGARIKGLMLDAIFILLLPPPCPSTVSAMAIVRDRDDDADRIPRQALLEYP